jgi:ribosomal protein S19
VAKSAWKFLQTNQEEIYNYIQEFKLIIENQGFRYIGLKSNGMIINGLNYMHRYSFYLGNSYAKKQFASYCIGSKAGEFLKYTKPFNYRSKKKNK